jgi:hypothetical protein
VDLVAQRAWVTDVTDSASQRLMSKTTGGRSRERFSGRFHLQDTTLYAFAYALLVRAGKMVVYRFAKRAFLDFRIKVVLSIQAWSRV